MLQQGSSSEPSETAHRQQAPPRAPSGASPMCPYYPAGYPVGGAGEGCGTDGKTELPGGRRGRAARLVRCSCWPWVQGAPLSSFWRAGSQHQVTSRTSSAQGGARRKGGVWLQSKGSFPETGMVGLRRGPELPYGESSRSSRAWATEGGRGEVGREGAGRNEQDSRCAGGRSPTPVSFPTIGSLLSK